MRLIGLAVSVTLSLTLATVAAQEPPAAPDKPEPKPPAVLELPPVEVIGATPLPTLGTPIEKYPGNVQSITGTEIEHQKPLDISDSLYRRLGSVNINTSQGNPWQNDVTYRGFLASPLTGSPIGLSVYLDGMRFNDGFGDTVNWDLIAPGAISGIDIIPGSNPIFGLNTLGGALAVRTKNGRDFPGTSLEVSGGSFGRWAVEAEHGGFRGPFDWFISFRALNEDGWRDESPTELRQLFTKVGWESAGTAAHLSFGYANNELVGNALAPESLLARDRSAVYTFADETKNLMYLVNVTGSHQLTESLQLSANAFYRFYRRRTLNGDAEVACVDDASGSQAFNPNGQLVHLGLCQGSAAGLVDQDGNPLTGNLELEAEAEDRKTQTETNDWGATLQLSHTSKIFGRGNRLTVGAAYDQHQTHFTQSQADGVFAPKGNSTGVNQAGDFATVVDVETTQQNIGVYFTDTFDLTEQLSLTLAGRYQYVKIEIRDQSGQNPDVNGDHTFDRFSPAVGLTYRPFKNLTLFGSYSEGFRAPTPAELTCADPNDPCNLPNAFLADPPLDPVVARTYEFGARGKLPFGQGINWSLAFFRTDLQDDILFVVTQSTSGGFFQNVDQTRRQGVEAGLSGGWKRLQYFLNYAYVDATYQTHTTLASVTEPAGVQVSPGDHIPGIPQHNLKVGAELAILDNLWLGANVIAASGTYLRGDDGNDHSKTDPYAILNLNARYQPFKHVELWARIDNVTNTKYETAGALNFNAFADPIAVERFLAPGAPIGAWAGVRVSF